MRYWIILVLFFAMCTTTSDVDEVANDPSHLHMAAKKLTDIIVHDIFSPPQASRIYAYASIAAYESMAAFDLQPSIQPKLKMLQEIPRPDSTVLISPYLAATQAFMQVGKALIFSEAKMEAHMEEQYDLFKKEGLNSRIINQSKAYGDQVADHILAWADKDNYKQSRTFPKFEITSEQARWRPTPPDYMEGIEPHWNTIRTFVIDSATQFTPPIPTQFDMDKESQFYAELIEVYETVNNLSDEQKQIAEFWDCNPYVSHHKGHVMFATKKITPGGHWMGITSLVSIKANADFATTSKAYAFTAIALADAFISCWDEKYRSKLVRPETLINEYIDADWLPILQTPPFPEYTSGHSVISAAASEMLTAIYGDNFAFDDSVELEYGLPVRNYSSFRQAAEEAAISRLYGGIHYMPAIANGLSQGRKLGAFVIDQLAP